MATTTVTNTTKGYRGFIAKGGQYVELAPGASVEGVEFDEGERESAERTGYFEFGGSATSSDDGGKALGEMSKAELEAVATAEGVDLSKAKNNGDRVAAIEAHRAASGQGGGIPPIVPPAGDGLDAMSDADLKATVAGLTGKPEADLSDDRAELLKLARGE